MKKITNNFLRLAFATLTFTSCGDDNVPQPIDPPVSDVIENLHNGILLGNLYEDYTLDASVQYNLTGQFTVSNGADLTIPAGTTIVAEAGGTEVYIAVLKGSKIFIQGNSSNPVIMSSNSGDSGDWGGLTICGEATTTAGVDAIAEVGGFVYGGTNDNDSSGSISFLQIVGSGAQINSESQYNGVSFYAVGSGTTVNNVAVISGADDGIEFFGGTVHISDLYLENNDDDSIDWTEGWSGGIENAYISHTNPGFSTVFEGDKDNANPTFENITAISTVGGTALQFKKESGATITGLLLSGYDVDLDMKDGGSLSNVVFDSSIDSVIIKEDGDSNFYNLLGSSVLPTVDISDFDWVGN